MLAHRAGPALPSYLALHHAGFSVPPVSPPERWALTPSFHPCQTLRALRRRPAGFPARCHRAVLRRRSILCGTFRSSAAPHPDLVGTLHAEACNSAFQQTLRGRPPDVIRRVALSRVPLTALRSPLKTSAWRPPIKTTANGQRASGRCPDFPPAPTFVAASFAFFASRFSPGTSPLHPPEPVITRPARQFYYTARMLTPACEERQTVRQLDFRRGGGRSRDARYTPDGNRSCRSRLKPG